MVKESVKTQPKTPRAFGNDPWHNKNAMGLKEIFALEPYVMMGIITVLCVVLLIYGASSGVDMSVAVSGIAIAGGSYTMISLASDALA